MKNRLKLVDLEVVTNLDNLDFNQQALLVQSCGLLVTTSDLHLAFSVLSSQNSNIIELAPTFDKPQFLSFAQAAGVKYWVSVGGAVESNIPSDLSKCNKKYSQCNGDPLCFEKNMICSKSEITRLRMLPFSADLEELETRISSAIKDLQSSCNGIWEGVAV